MYYNCATAISAAAAPDVGDDGALDSGDDDGDGCSKIPLASYGYCDVDGRYRECIRRRSLVHHDDAGVNVVSVLPRHSDSQSRMWMEKTCKNNSPYLLPLIQVSVYLSCWHWVKLRSE